MCQEIVGDEINPLLKAKRIYEYVTDRVRYSYVRRYSTILNIPEYAAVNQKGDCGVQAVLFIALCRCAGVRPAGSPVCLLRPTILADMMGTVLCCTLRLAVC